MRMHAKASSAEWISSGAPRLGLLVLVVALFLVSVPSAFAVESHPRTGAVDTSGTTHPGEGLRDLAVNPANGDLYAAALNGATNSSGGIYRFDSSGSFLNTIDGSATPQGALSFGEPIGLAVDGNSGTVYVTDTYNNVVDAFTSAGALVASFSGDGQLDGSATPAATFSSPCGLAVNQSNGRLYVGDQGNNRVWIFSNTGAYLGALGDSTLNGPCGVAVDSTGGVYVRNAGDGKVIHFNADGSFAGIVYAPGNNGTPEDFSDDLPPATAIAVNGSNDHLFVDTGDRFNEYDAGGTLLNTSGRGELSVSAGIAVDSANGRFYAGQEYSAIYVYGPTAVVPTPEVTIAPPVVAGLGAHFAGTVDPNGVKTEYRFELAVDDGTPNWEALGGGSSSALAPVTIEADRDLVAATKYLVRVFAVSGGGEAISAPEAFAIGTAAPTVQAIPGSGRTTSDLRLNGTINPNGLPTTYHFEWGTSTAYGNVIPSGGGDAYGGQGAAMSRYSKPISGLAPNTTIHYRVIAQNSAGQSVSADRTVTTLSQAIGYEMVSPVDKNGSNLFFCCHAQASLDGSRAEYFSAGVFSGGNSNLQLNTYRSTRGADNWDTKFLPLKQTTVNGGITNGGTQGFSQNLSHMFQFSREALLPGAVESNSNMYLRNIDTGGLQFVATFADSGFGMGISDAGIFMGSSPDGSHMVFRSPVALTPGASANGNIYDFTNGELKLVSTLPNGTAATQVQAGLNSGGKLRRLFNMVSEDGSRVFFVGDGSAVYLHEEGKPTRIVSASQRTGDDPTVAHQVDESWASRDGSTVYFTAYDALTDDVTPNPPNAYLEHLYRYDVESGELTSVVPGGGGPSDTNFVGTILGVSDDGSTVYYAGGHNFIETEQASWIYPINRVYAAEDGVSRFLFAPDTTGVGGFVSPNGRYFAFRSPDLNLVSPAAASCAGCDQIFSYDLATDRMECVSCNPSGAPATSPGDWVEAEENTGGYVNRVMLDDGRVFFQSDDQLVPEDTNEKLDVYQWNAGQIDLVSRGYGKENSFLGDVTPDGKSVFFYTGERLVTQDVDDAQDLYVARVGGGMPGQNPPLPEPPCFGEGCLNRSPDRPADVIPGSNSFDGPANPKPAATRKCGKGKHRVKVRGKSKCVKRTAAKAARRAQSRNGGHK